MQTLLFALSAFALILVGLFGALTRHNLVRILLALNILETGVNLLLVALGTFEGGSAPIITRRVVSASDFVDPLPQALVLTSIVIGLGVTALALTMILRFYRRRGSLDLAAAAAGPAAAAPNAEREECEP
jgi:multicomponent Na+:H+ antiporter subunit C